MKKLTLLLTGLSLSACATAAPDPAPAPMRGEDFIGPPLPAHSQWEAAGSTPPQEIDLAPEHLEGTYRPDDKTPAERIPDIVARGRVVVGVDQANNLLSYRDTVTGELQGFEIDLAREVARDIFGTPDAVDFRFVSSADRVKALQEGRVDFIIRSMSVTAQRQAELDFSLPYLTSDTRMLVETRSGITSLEDVAGRTACAALGSTSIEWVRGKLPQTNILAVHDWGDCLMALQQGQADAVVTDDVLLSGMQDQDPYTTIVGDLLQKEDYAIAVNKGAVGLVRQINSTLLRTREDGTWDALFRRWLGAYLEEPTLPAPNFRKED